MSRVVSSWEGRSMVIHRKAFWAGPLCAAMHISSEPVAHAASSREGPFHSPAPGHCQSPFSWWSITLVGNSSMSVSSNKFEKHFSELSLLPKDHYADIHRKPTKSSCYTQRKGPHITVPNKKQAWTAEKSHGSKIFPGTQVQQSS